MAEFIKQSWLFPVIQSVHIIGLTMLVGTTCLVDFRLLGMGMRRQTASDIASGLVAMDNGRITDGIGDGTVDVLVRSRAVFEQSGIPLEDGVARIGNCRAFHSASSRCARQRQA